MKMKLLIIAIIAFCAACGKPREETNVIQQATPTHEREVLSVEDLYGAPPKSGLVTLYVEDGLASSFSFFIEDYSHKVSHYAGAFQVQGWPHLRAIKEPLSDSVFLQTSYINSKTHGSNTVKVDDFVTQYRFFNDRVYHLKRDEEVPYVAEATSALNGNYEKFLSQYQDIFPKEGKNWLIRYVQKEDGGYDQEFANFLVGIEIVEVRQNALVFRWYKLGGIL